LSCFEINFIFFGLEEKKMNDATTINHEALYNCFVFPKTSSLGDEKAIVTVKYACWFGTDKNECNFFLALSEIEKNKDLLDWKSREDALLIVKDIDSHQDDYIPHKLDGITIKRLGTNILKLENERKPHTATGFIEFNDYKTAQRKSNQENENKQTQAKIYNELHNANSYKCEIM